MKNILIIADKGDIPHLTIEREHPLWNLYWHILNFDEIEKGIPSLNGIIAKNNIDLVLYSQNEQVSRASIGKVTTSLGTGYSSFSGIDREFRTQQMETCFKDFLKPGVDTGLVCKKIEPEDAVEKTFSLIFDLEQLGGARFGLPRITKVLEMYNVPATFFTTNIIHEIYPNILKELHKAGHEIGVHGLYHEFLSRIPREKQEENITKMLDGYSDFGVRGANFVGRMNRDTVGVLAEKGFSYFIFSLKNTIKLLSCPSNPLPISHDGNIMWMVPLPVETYNKTWEGIKKQIDNTKMENSSHITVLMHPFYDGAKGRVENVTRTIEYLSELGFQPIRLDRKIESLKVPEVERLIGFNHENKNLFGGKKFDYLINRFLRNRQIQNYYKHPEKTSFII
jgi:peptidoglycan/xylan/chitin deacetylase (PgdA/CDA1 family)